MGAVLIEFSTVIGSQDKVASEIEPGRIVELDTVGARSQLLFSAVPVTASRDPGSGNFLPLAISAIPTEFVRPHVFTPVTNALLFCLLLLLKITSFFFSFFFFSFFFFFFSSSLFFFFFFFLF